MSTGSRKRPIMPEARKSWARSAPSIEFTRLLAISRRGRPGPGRFQLEPAPPSGNVPKSSAKPFHST
jgi:hypothetical protein